MMHIKIVLICFLAVILERGHFVSSYASPIQSSIRFRPAASIKLPTYSFNHQRLAMTLSSEMGEISGISGMKALTTRSGRILRTIREKSPVVLRKVGTFVLPLLFQLSVMVLFSFVHPAAAKTARKSMSKAATVTAKVPLWKKVLEGVNTSGAFKARKAGDTRTEFSAILNSISSILILGAIFFGAFLRHLQRESYQTTMMRKELKKVDEYKENMYFEAVQDILSKISDTKTKGSAKASLQKQLKDLDPEGAIQRFLDGGDRPDISHIINRKPAPKGKKVAGGDKMMKKKKAPEVTSDYSDDNDDDDVKDVKPSKMNNKMTPKSPNTPTPKAPEKEPVDETYLMMLGELYDGLDGVMSDDSRANVVEYLKQRIESISDLNKRAATIRKIAEKLEDNDYWVDYAAKLG